MPARLAQHLVARGLLSAHTIEDAQRRRATYGGTLDTVLLEMGAIAEAGMLQALADVSGLKPVNLADFEPNEEMARFVPANVAERLGAVPLSVDGGVLHVATSYPPNQRELEQVALLLGKKLEPWVAIEARVRDWISVVYGSGLLPRYDLLLRSLDPTRAPQPAPPPAPKKAAEPIPLTTPSAQARPPAARPPESPKTQARDKVIAVSEPTLEDALTRDVVEQIARAVAEEPILLEVRKKPKTPPPEPKRPEASRPPPPAEDDEEPTIQEERTQRVDVRELQRQREQRTDAVRDETRPIDLAQYQHLLKPELHETKSFDLSKLAAQTATPETPATPPPPPSGATTWDRDATVSIDLQKYGALARESAVATDEPTESSGRAATNLPSIAPSIAPPVTPTLARGDAAGSPTGAEHADAGAPGFAPGAATPGAAPSAARGASAPASSAQTTSLVPTPAPARTTTSAEVAAPGSGPASRTTVASDSGARGTPVATSPASAPARATISDDSAARGAPVTPAIPGGITLRGGTPSPAAPAEPEAPARWVVSSPATADVAPEAPRPMSPAGFPGVIVFPNPNAKPAAAAAQAPGPLAVARPAVESAGGGVEWSLQQARTALKEATQDRDKIIRVALAFARRTFDFVAAFAIVHGAAAGWAAEGEGAERFQQSPPTIPLDSASVFRTVAMTRGSYVGPVPPDALTGHYLQQLGRAPRTLFLFPVEVKDRLICLLYGDPGSRPISQRRLSDLLLFCQDLPGAFQELIVFRKQKFGASQKTALSLEEVVPQPVAAGMGWGPAASAGQSGMGRVAGAPMVIEDPTRAPPADFAPILKKLTGPDATARAAAMAELARSPDASAKMLVQNFPGPTAWTRLPVQELPDADELGPIPAALSRLGRSAAQALAPLLDSDDADIRYFALLTAGNLPHSELVGGVLRGIFDYEPDISSAARAAAAALRRVPRFLEAMKDLRQELADTDTIRRSLAARALGVLHDREAVDGLINLTGSDDELCAQAAAEALREITRAHFGPDPRSWTAWWAENRSRSRGEWLVAALRHPELDVRLSAIEELSKALNDNYGYFADATPRDREGAIKKWEAALANNPRLRKLE